MVCTYKFFTGDRLCRTQTGERSPLWCTSLIFAQAYGQFLIPPVMLRQINHYTQDIHYNIPSDWVVQNSPSGYMYRDGWHKSMDRFPSMCCSSPLNPQVLFYDGHDSHFDDMALDILCKNNIQYFIPKAGYSVHDQTNDNGPIVKLNNLYGNTRMNCTRDHGTLKFSTPHMNSVLVETWGAFKLSSVTITQQDFKKTNTPPLSPPDIDTNLQACLAGTQQSNTEKADDIGCIEKVSIAPIHPIP